MVLIKNLKLFDDLFGLIMLFCLVIGEFEFVKFDECDLFVCVFLLLMLVVIIFCVVIGLFDEFLWLWLVKIINMVLI